MMTNVKVATKRLDRQVLNRSSIIQPSERMDKHKQEHPAKSHSFQYKGITLKQYFRIGEEGVYNHYKPAARIDQLDEEAYCSSKQAQTPAFTKLQQPLDNNYHPRKKMKTEIPQHHHHDFTDKTHMQTEIYTHQNKIIMSGPQHKIAIVGHQKVIQFPHQSFQKPKRKFDIEKTIYGNGKRHFEHHQRPKRKSSQNRSTLSSFNQVDKKTRMMKKIKQDKEKVNELRLSEAFFITKYCKKFNLNMMTNQFK